MLTTVYWYIYLQPVTIIMGKTSKKMNNSWQTIKVLILTNIQMFQMSDTFTSM